MCSATLYFDIDPPELPEITVVCLQLGTGKSARNKPSIADNGLVLMKAESEQPEVYRRVGMFDVGSKDEDWLALRRERTIRIV